MINSIIADLKNENQKMKNLKMKNLGERSVGLPNVVKRGCTPCKTRIKNPYRNRWGFCL